MVTHTKQHDLVLKGSTDRSQSMNGPCEKLQPQKIRENMMPFIWSVHSKKIQRRRNTDWRLLGCFCYPISYAIQSRDYEANADGDTVFQGSHRKSACQHRMHRWRVTRWFRVSHAFLVWQQFWQTDALLEQKRNLELPLSLLPYDRNSGFQYIKEDSGFLISKL